MPPFASTSSIDASLLLVDDDPTRTEVLGRALARRGYAVTICNGVSAARAAIEDTAPDYAVVDLRMPDGSGLALIAELRRRNPRARIVVLTGFASIATAIEAIKLGATYYLTKPVDADSIVGAFGRCDGDSTIALDTAMPTVGRVEWEHIQRVLAANDGNISAAARQLRMHRRTLQRKLAKHPPAK